ncbi:MAG: FtsX-like permease family protein [Clostridia bacterium]|nr:FtsX-like permease family protein [Clostridia bacterium]
MKKTQIKDAIRNVKRQWVSFVSVIVIAMLGVTAYLGMEFTARSMRLNGSDMYNDRNFRDIELVSTMLFTKEDLEDIKKVEGVADAEALCFTEAQVTIGNSDRIVNVITLTERINAVEVRDGTLPTSVGECAVDEFFAEDEGLSVGDVLKLCTTGSEKVEYLVPEEVTITATVFHPDHVNSINPETPYVIVTWDSFDSEKLDGCYMKTEITVDKPDGIYRFSDEYYEIVDTVASRIEEAAVSCTARRYAAVTAAAQDKIDESQEKLDDALEELKSARKALDRGQYDLEKGEKEATEGEIKLEIAKPQLDEAEKQIEDGKKKLDEARATLDAEWAKLNAGKAALDNAKAQLNDAKAKLEEGYTQIADAKSDIRKVIIDAYTDVFGEESANGLVRWAKEHAPNVDDPNESVRYFWITDNIRIDLETVIKDVVMALISSPNISKDLLTELYIQNVSKVLPLINGETDFSAVREGIADFAASSSGDLAKLSDGVRDWDRGHDEYIKGLEKYRESYALYSSGLEQINAAEAQYTEAYYEYKSGVDAFNAKKEEYEKGVLDLEEGKKKLVDGKKELDDGEAKYEDGLSQYNEGVEKIADARHQLETLAECRWIVIDANGSSGFVQIQIGSENITNLKMTFSMMFIVVGSLVIFATVGKMVDEQRSLVGTTKALGFFTREIFSKYLIFGVAATAIGTILGIFVALFIIVSFLLGAVNRFYFFDLSKPAFFAGPAVIAVVAGILLSVAAIWLACARLLREPAIRLIQPKAPDVKKRSGGGSRLSLYSRLIMLNMRTDLKRVIVTIVSVAGCAALVVIGFTLKTAIGGVVDKEYGEIVKYDINVRFDPEVSDSAEQEIKEILDSYGTDSMSVLLSDSIYNITTLQAATVFCGDLNEMQQFYKLDDWETGRPMFATNEGVLIQRRIAESFGLEVNDTFELAFGGINVADVRVAGIFENYVGKAIMMSPGYYETLFGNEAKPNAFLVRLNGADVDELTEALNKVVAFENVKSSDTDKRIIVSSTSTINAAVLIFILIAAIMAGVVQMNLTNMYIIQKKRELTIMRVNGFSVKEVINYVLRETFVTTTVGILLGVGAGSGIAYIIVRTIEQTFVQFDRSVNFVAWLIAAALTVLFTAIVNFIALRKIKYLKLTDVA